jgi:hypothetical protein
MTGTPRRWRAAALWLALLALAPGCGQPLAARGKTLGEWLDLVRRSNDVAELKSAAAALAELGPHAEPAAWELVRLLSDRQAFGHYRSMNEAQVDEAFRALADALRAIGSAAAPVVLQAVERGRPVSADVMRALHDSALPELARGLAHPALKVRRGMAERWRDLGARGKPGAPMLVLALRDPDEKVRGEAAKSLGAVSADPDLAAPALVEALGDQLPVVRLAAAESLAAFQSRAAAVLPALAERLGDPDQAVCDGVVASVARFRDHKELAAPLLAAKLAGKDERARHAAMRAAIGADALRLLPPEVLAPFIESPDGDFALKAVETLMETNPKAALLAPALVGRLRTLGDASTAPRQDAFAVIGVRAVPALVRMLAYKGQSAPPSEQEIKEAEVVRYEAAMALAAIGNVATEAVPKLQEMSVAEPSEHVRSAVIEALHRIKSSRAGWKKK